MNQVEKIKCKLSVKIINAFIVILAILFVGFIITDEVNSVNEINNQRKIEYNEKKLQIEKEENDRKEKILSNENRIKEIDIEIKDLNEEARKYSDIESEQFSVTKVKEINDKKTNLFSEKNQLSQENFRLNNIKSEEVLLNLKNINILKITSITFIVGILVLVICKIVYQVGNKEAIKARNFKIQQMKREMELRKREQDRKRVQENIEAIGSSIGKAMANVAKEINPTYKAFTCPNCGANLDGADLEKCDYCGTKLTKVGKFK